MRRLSFLFATLALFGCDETLGDGDCAEDSDCADDEACVVDLTRNLSYCAAVCVVETDCPFHQSCRTSHPRVVGLESLEQRVCVDDVRACGDVEICNGLDDDCDGVVDGADCEVVDGCLSDASCGSWRCQAPQNQPLALCAPGIDGGASDFAACSVDADCANGVCETGFCSPFCRSDDRDGCPSVVADGQTFSSICARSVGLSSRPAHNKCQIQCDTSSDCPNGLQCVWRDVYQGEDLHHWVCAIPEAGRAPLGTACTNNQPDVGDDECQSGLCFGRRCTRSCGGPGSSCGDVGSEFVCRDVDLYYGELTFGAYVCVVDQ